MTFTTFISIFNRCIVRYIIVIHELSLAANVENSNLYLKLFKLVFGSVSLFASENEQMLKVYYFVNV